MSFIFFGFGRFCFEYLLEGIKIIFQSARSVSIISPVYNAVILIHHSQNCCLIGGVNRSDGDVTHSSELAAIVQVLVLKSEEVPNEPSEDLQRSQNRRHQIAANDLVLCQNE